MVNLHGPKLVEGDSWLRYCEGVYEERGVVEDEDLCTSGGCLEVSVACASLQPFDESSGSGKLQPQAEEIDFKPAGATCDFQPRQNTMAALVNYGSSDEEGSMQEETLEVNVRFYSYVAWNKLTAQIPGRKRYLLTNYLCERRQLW
jgi:hypothetical protein